MGVADRPAEQEVEVLMPIEAFTRENTAPTEGEPAQWCDVCKAWFVGGDHTTTIEVPPA